MKDDDSINNLNGPELNEELKKARHELMQLRINISSRQSKETAKLTLLRKKIARIRTRQTTLSKQAPEREKTSREK